MSRDLFCTPPPQPTEQKPGQLSPQQVQDFFDKGVLLVEDFYDPTKELEPVKAGIEEIVEKLAQELLAAGKITNTHSDADLFHRLTLLEQECAGASVLFHPVATSIGSRVFRHIWASDRILNLIEQLVGPNIAGHCVWNFRPKTPKTESHDVPWHQDEGYMTEEGDQTLQITAWIPFLDTDEKNGCLQVIPGGHKTGKVGPHKGCWEDTWYIYMDDEDMAQLGVDPVKDVVTYPVKYGSILFFNNLVPHRSLPNLSDKIRWSLDLRWHDANKPNGFPVKESIILRQQNQPNYEPEYKAFDRVDRGRATDVPLWRQRWPLVHKNHYSALWNDL